MNYIIYKTTNKVNGRFYIGKHKTSTLDFDGYLGSGMALKAAIKKYGEENFERQTIAVFDRQEDMDNAELEIVCERFLLENAGLCYNLAVGGKGGFSVIDDESQMAVNIATLPHVRKKISERGLIAQNRPDVKRRKSESQRGEKNHRFGKTLSEEERLAMSALLKGRVKSEVERLKLSRALKGHVVSPETAKKISLANTGKTHSEETRQKMALKRLGEKHDPATIEKIRAAKTGYVHALLTCPQCSLQGRGPNMSRYHFDNCKLKEAA